MEARRADVQACTMLSRQEATSMRRAHARARQARSPRRKAHGGVAQLRESVIRGVLRGQRKEGEMDRQRTSFIASRSMHTTANATGPGYHVVWKYEDGTRSAIGQSVNAIDRTAPTELASPLELDPNGSSDNDADNLQTSDLITTQTIYRLLTASECVMRICLYT